MGRKETQAQTPMAPWTDASTLQNGQLAK